MFSVIICKLLSGINISIFVLSLLFYLFKMWEMLITGLTNDCQLFWSQYISCTSKISSFSCKI